MIWLWLALSASATQVEQDMVQCPIGDEPVRIHRLISRNTAGWDSDGARYASDGQWRSYDIATCPNNLLSLYSADMGKELPAEDTTRLAPFLAGLQTEGIDADKLALWQRYELAARAYDALGRDDKTVAYAYLRASWSVRDAIVVGGMEGLRGPAHARLMLEQARPVLTQNLPASQRKILLFNLAKIAHRAGLDGDRAEFVAEIGKLKPHTQAEQDAIVALTTLAAVEATYQDKAIARLADPAKTDLGAAYLLADLLRRRKHPEQALVLFDRVAKDPESDDALRQMSTYLAAELRGERPWQQKKAERLMEAAPEIVP